MGLFTVSTIKLIHSILFHMTRAINRVLDIEREHCMSAGQCNSLASKRYMYMYVILNIDLMETHLSIMLSTYFFENCTYIS